MQIVDCPHSANLTTNYIMLSFSTAGNKNHNQHHFESTTSNALTISIPRSTHKRTQIKHSSKTIRLVLMVLPTEPLTIHVRIRAYGSSTENLTIEVSIRAYSHNYWEEVTCKNSACQQIIHYSSEQKSVPAKLQTWGEETCKQDNPNKNLNFILQTTVKVSNQKPIKPYFLTCRVPLLAETTSFQACLKDSSINLKKYVYKIQNVSIVET